MINRRHLFKSGLGALSVFCSGLGLARAAHAAEDGRRFLTAALQCAAWLQRTRQETDHGVTWPVDPLQPSVSDASLYAGAPGILPFWLELHRATGDAAPLKEALLGADHIAATQLTDERLHDSQTGLGFYDSMAGLGYVMELVQQVSGQSKYRQAAQRVVTAMHDRTRAGADWTDTNDVISGVAGSGLFLLWWSQQANDPKALALARSAGRVLVSRARPAPGGIAWYANSSMPTYYPNFSHGTAGVAYFLAALSKVSGEREFQRAALEGARHLQKIATCNGDGCLIRHHEPDGEQLYYLGWCHGPAGTSRLYHLLAQLTGERSWRNAVRRSAEGLLRSGIPVTLTPGFWNNVSQCCGSAGVAEAMLTLYQSYGDRRYLDFAHLMTEDLLRRATVDETGMRWVQAENRRSPDDLVAQTGYMQGVAGIGTWLLHLDGQLQRRAPTVIFPDAAWSRS